MSKRFGRQQKRKMRQRIAALEAKVQIVEMIGARNRQIVQDTAEVLGNFFMTLPTSCYEIKELDRLEYDWRMPVVAGIGQAETFCEVALPILQGGTAVDQLRPHMHVRFKLAGHNVGYGIKPESLLLYNRNRRRELMTEEIAKILAYHLNNSMEAMRHG